MYTTTYIKLLQRVATCSLATTATTKIIAICGHTIIASRNELNFFTSIREEKKSSMQIAITKHTYRGIDRTENDS